MARRAHKLAWRSLRRAVLTCLLIGLAANVAAAWTCALAVRLSARKPLVAQASPEDPLQTWTVRIWSGRGALRVSSQRFGGVKSARTKTDPSEILPRWTGYDVPCRAYVDGDVFYESLLADARGWPLVSMWSETQRAFSTAPSLRYGLAIGNRVLPLRPLWTGFLADTLLYCLVALTLSSSWIVRRFRRLWQHRCLACGYPIGSSTVCTECGRRLARQASSRRGAARSIHSADE